MCVTGKESSFFIWKYSKACYCLAAGVKTRQDLQDCKIHPTPEQTSNTSIPMYMMGFLSSE